MYDISTQFGKAVRKIRLKQRLSRGGVARRLNFHRSYISGIDSKSIEKVPLICLQILGAVVLVLGG